MTAKEMFEELGYERNTNIYLRSDYLDKKFIDYYKGKIHITFSSFSEPNAFCKFKESLFSNKTQDITVQEFKAIQKQIEELGW